MYAHKGRGGEASKMSEEKEEMIADIHGTISSEDLLRVAYSTIAFLRGFFSADVSSLKQCFLLRLDTHSVLLPLSILFVFAFLDMIRKHTQCFKIATINGRKYPKLISDKTKSVSEFVHAWETGVINALPHKWLDIAKLEIHAGDPFLRSAAPHIPTISWNATLFLSRTMKGVPPRSALLHPTDWQIARTT